VIADRGALKNHVRASLSVGRYLHSLRTAGMAVELAERFQYSSEEAEVAGIAHDMSREFSDSELLRLASLDTCPLLSEELTRPVLLHGSAAAVLLADEWGETRQSVLSAVRRHTQGDMDMGKLGMLLFVADYLEPGRAHVSGDFRNKVLEMNKLEMMVLEIVRNKNSYLRENGIEVSVRTGRMVRYIREGMYAFT